MPSCCIKECKSRRRAGEVLENITFHRFPTDPERRDKWIQLIRAYKRDQRWSPTNNTVVCSKHFTEDSFYVTPKGYKRIQITALPILLEVISAEPVPVNINYEESIFDTPHNQKLKRENDRLNILKRKHRQTICNLQKRNRRLQKSLKAVGREDLIGKIIDDPFPTLNLPKNYGDCSSQCKKKINESINIEESEEEEEMTEENTFAEELNFGDRVNPKTGDSRKRVLDTESNEEFKKSRHDIDDVEIDYENIDKFGEQIAFLLKRIPRKLCRELQDSIVTLIKTETKKHESNITASTSSNTKKFKTTISRPTLTPSLDLKLDSDEEITIKEEAKDKLDEEESANEPTQATQDEEKPIGTSANLSTTIKIFPKPMKLPIELVGSLDFVKKEVLDPEESSITKQEQYNKATNSEVTWSDPLETDIKIETDEFDDDDDDLVEENR